MGKHNSISIIVLLAFTLGLVVLPGTAAADTTQTLGEFTFTVDKAPKNGDEITMNTSRAEGDKKGKRSHGKKRSKSTFAMKTFDDANQCKASGYSIQVINGKNRGKNRVSSAKVILNDQVLYRQKDFKQGKKFKSISAPLDINLIKPTGNVLKVLVNGKPGAYVKVSIYGAYSEGSPNTGMVTWYMDFDGDGYGGDHGPPFAPKIVPVGVVPDPVAGYDSWSEKGGDCLDGTGTAEYTEHSRSINPDEPPFEYCGEPSTTTTCP